MKHAMNNIFHRLHRYFASDELNVLRWDEELLRDFYSYNISLSITAAAMLCVISLIGLVGTHTPYSTSFLIPGTDVTAVYLIIFGTNVLFLAALLYARSHLQRVLQLRLRQAFAWFSGINMVFASATLFTSQLDSSFFFEYILITIVIYLVPNAEIFFFFRNMAINVVSVVIVLVVAKLPIAWQDLVDIVALQVICAVVNRSRLQSFKHREQDKLFIEKQKEQFYHDSRTDELTRLGNRMALRSDFSNLLKRPLCVALIDLDFFKKYNDTRGHAYGDQVLEMTGRYMNRIFHTAGDHCYRYGGDEFLIISESDDPASFRKRLEAFREMFCSERNNVKIACSIGYYADLPRTEEDLRGMIKSADQYLYWAKAEGSGQIDGGVGEALSKKGSGSAAAAAGGGSSAAASSEAGQDPLTGLPDMRAFFALMKQEREKKREVTADGELAVLYFDLINFRMVNLLYGMPYGDEMLKRMGESLRDSFPGAAVSRWDVDHFVVFTDTRDLEKKADAAIERINGALSVRMECSVGACVWEDHSLDAETVCSHAREASDENRKKVGIHFSYYTEAMGITLDTDAFVVSHIDEAVREGWIVVYYQPIIRALSNRICGMEALARWKDPERGILPPADFIKPLEDARQIYKLDLCVIRQVVKLIADRYRQKLPEIPISINLSRLDFLCCDIYQEIENLVMDYDIPRRMLQIEVTESIVMSEEDETLKALRSFRAAGYEIWMDDFGSGYSTLNLLKDYSFDLLKLDMAFLRSNSSRSRSIIGSVIEMDKKLGIRTLAEGVETEEQVEYLKKSGCEKLQGYYFGRPMPFEDALKNCLDKGIDVESAKQKICYDALGHVDFMTDIPMIIAELRGDRNHLLFANDPGLLQLQQDGFEDLESLENNLNDRRSVASREMMKAVRRADTVNDGGEMTAFFNGKRRLLKYQMLGAYDDTRLLVMHVYGQSLEEGDIALQNQFLMNLTYFYRYLFIINAEDMTIQSMRFVDLPAAGRDVEAIRDKNGHYASVLPAVFEADRKRYDAFLDPATLKKRLEQAKYRSICGVFRTREAYGRYIWMSHRLLLVPNAGSQQILYVIRTLDGLNSSEELSSPQQGLQALYEETGGSPAMKAEYFDSLMRHIPLPVFWKDRECRFLGASQSFLDYYGFASVDEILGRTDQDMGWHLNNEVYEEDEKEVILTDQMHRNVPGRCISKGVSHEIYATKWPTYQNGKVSGLMGYFLDESTISAEKRNPEGNAGADTGMGNRYVSRFLDGLADYYTDYQLNHRNFGVLYIGVPELIRIADKFGHASMRSVTQACVRVIRDALNHVGFCECLTVGGFAASMALADEHELKEKADAIRQGIDAIRSVDGIPCSLYAKVETFTADEILRLNRKMMRLIYSAETRTDRTEDPDGRVPEQAGAEPTAH